MIKSFFFAIFMFWAGSTQAEEPATASASKKSDAAIETPAEQPDRSASRDGRKRGNPAVVPADRQGVSDATRRERTSAGDAERASAPVAGQKPDPKLPARPSTEGEPRSGESSKREPAGSEDAAADLPADLDSQSFGTGAEGGEAAVQEANVLGAAGAGEQAQQRLPPMDVLFAAVGALFVVLLTTAAVLERLDLAKLRKTIVVQGDRITTVNGRIDQHASLQIAPLQDQLKHLKERIEALERKNASMPNAPLIGRSHEHEDPFARRPPLTAPPPPRFPALVSEVLAQSTSAMIRVKADPIDQDMFVPSNDGAFYLVQDGTAGLCVIPAHEPMTTQLYKTYYKSSYDCSAQGTGDVYVVEPATVSARGDLWRLASRGKLEVRAS